jgi:hypothetical protein
MNIGRGLFRAISILSIIGAAIVEHLIVLPDAVRGGFRRSSTP